MTLAQAQAVVGKVIADAPAPVSVFVADEAGELVAAATMDGAAPDTRAASGPVQTATLDTPRRTRAEGRTGRRFGRRK